MTRLGYRAPRCLTVLVSLSTVLIVPTNLSRDHPAASATTVGSVVTHGPTALSAPPALLAP